MDSALFANHQANIVYNFANQKADSVLFKCKQTMLKAEEIQKRHTSVIGAS